MADRELVITAKEAAPLLGCVPRTLVDDISKRPGFPPPVSRKPLTWAKWRILEWRDSSPVLPLVRRRSRCSKASAKQGSDAR